MNTNNGSGLLATLGGTTLHDIYNFRHSKIYEDQTNIVTWHCTHLCLNDAIVKEIHALVFAKLRIKFIIIFEVYQCQNSNA